MPLNVRSLVLVHCFVQRLLFEYNCYKKRLLFNSTRVKLMSSSVSLQVVYKTSRQRKVISKHFF